MARVFLGSQKVSYKIGRTKDEIRGFRETRASTISFGAPLHLIILIYYLPCILHGVLLCCFWYLLSKCIHVYGKFSLGWTWLDIKRTWCKVLLWQCLSSSWAFHSDSHGFTYGRADRIIKIGNWCVLYVLYVVLALLKIIISHPSYWEVAMLHNSSYRPFTKVSQATLTKPKHRH